MDRVELLRDRLGNLPLRTVYLFGSTAEGREGPLSDVDLAVVPQSEVRDHERLSLCGKVAGRASAVFGTEHADVVLLDEAPPGIAFHAIKGVLVVDRDPTARVLLEARIQSFYHDRRFHEARWERETLERYKRGAFA